MIAIRSKDFCAFGRALGPAAEARVCGHPSLRRKPGCTESAERVVTRQASAV